MRAATLTGLVVALLAVAPVSAANISIGDYLLPPNTSGQQVLVTVASSPPETARGLEFLLTIEANGPQITGVDLIGAGLMFAGGDPPVPDPSNTAWEIYYSTGSTTDRNANGTLARLTVSTVGVNAGVYSISLSARGNDTYLVDAAANVIPGNLTGGKLTVVPEPAVLVQLLGLAVLAPLAVFCRRRKRS